MGNEEADASHNRNYPKAFAVVVVPQPPDGSRCANQGKPIDCCPLARDVGLVVGTIGAHHDPKSFRDKLEELIAKRRQPHEGGNSCYGDGCNPPPGLLAPLPDLVPLPLARVVQFIGQVAAADSQNGPLVPPQEFKEPFQGFFDPGQRGRLDPRFGVVAPPACGVPAGVLQVHFHEPETLLNAGPHSGLQDAPSPPAKSRIDLADCLCQHDDSHHDRDSREPPCQLV